MRTESSGNSKHREKPLEYVAFNPLMQWPRNGRALSRVTQRVSVAGWGHRRRRPHTRALPNPQQGPLFSLGVLVGRSPYFSSLVLYQLFNCGMGDVGLMGKHGRNREWVDFAAEF